MSADEEPPPPSPPSDEGDEDSSSEEEVKGEQVPAPKKTKQQRTPTPNCYTAQLLTEKTGVCEDVMEMVVEKAGGVSISVGGSQDAIEQKVGLVGLAGLNHSEKWELYTLAREACGVFNIATINTEYFEDDGYLQGGFITKQELRDIVEEVAEEYANSYEFDDSNDDVREKLKSLGKERGYLWLDDEWVKLPPKPSEDREWVLCDGKGGDYHWASPDNMWDAALCDFGGGDAHCFDCYTAKRMSKLSNFTVQNLRKARKTWRNEVASKSCEECKMHGKGGRCIDHTDKKKKKKDKSSSSSSSSSK